MALSFKNFDQDMNGGWRKIAVAGCEEAAADLIRDWRTQNNASDIILFWHEGQLRAQIGQYSDAIKLFELSRKTEAEDAGWGWNIYVEGSIAFLEKNKAGLKKARRKLMKLPKPPGLDNSIDVDGNPVKVDWPLNLNVFDALLRCWGQSYKQAYACPPKLLVKGAVR